MGNFHHRVMNCALPKSDQRIIAISLTLPVPLLVHIPDLRSVKSLKLAKKKRV